MARQSTFTPAYAVRTVAAWSVALLLFFPLGWLFLSAFKTLFKAGSRYLAAISEYTMRDLKARKDPDTGENMGIAEDVFEEGAKPTAENYRNWNLTRKGLMFTFPPYQVAAYALGPQTVIIPTAELKSVVRTDGPLAKMEK